MILPLSKVVQMKWEDAIEKYFEVKGLKKGQYFTKQQKQYNISSITRARHTLAVFDFFVGKKSLKKMKIFEPGCGVGPVSILATKQGAFAVGCEIRRDFIKLGKILNKIEKGRAHFVLGDCLKMPFKENLFDYAFLWDVLEHTTQQKKFLKNTFKTVKCGGVVFSKISNRLFPIEPHTLLPFITYLPKKYSDTFVRVFRKDFYAWWDSYEKEIHIPTYGKTKNWFEGFDDVKFYNFFLHYIPYVGDFWMPHNILSFRLPAPLKKLFGSHSFIEFISNPLFIIFAKDWIVVAKKC